MRKESCMWGVRRRARLALLALLAPVADCDIAMESGWEVPEDTDLANLAPVLGYYGNVGSTAIVQSGCRSGTSCLEAVESPLSGTPQVYLAWISNLNAGDLVKGQFWAKGGVTSEVGIWGHWTDSDDDYNSFDESAGGSEVHVGAGKNWEQLSYTWTVPQDKVALLIRANIYATDVDDATVWIDDLRITLTSATALVATAPAWLSDFSIENGEPLGIDTDGADNLEVALVSSGCRSAPGCFKATESPLLGTPSIAIAAVHRLSPFDHVYAHAWFKGDGGATKGRVWATYWTEDGQRERASELGQYLHERAHDGGGPEDFAGKENAWSQSEYVWAIPPGKTGLTVEARVYVSDPTLPSILIDDILVSTNSTTAHVTVSPQEPSALRGERAKKLLKTAIVLKVVSSLIKRFKQTTTVCIDDCIHEFDDDCDDGGPSAEFSSCDYGTDCRDCGPRRELPPPPYIGEPQPPPLPPLPPPPPPSPHPPPPITSGEVLCWDSCEASRDGRCDDGGPDADTSLCAIGTDCGDCGDRDAYPPPMPPAPPHPDCANTCNFASDGDCDDGSPGSEFDVCPLGTDCADCRSGGESHGHPPPPSPSPPPPLPPP